MLYSLSSKNLQVHVRVCMHACVRVYMRVRPKFYRQITGYGMSVDDHRVA